MLFTVAHTRTNTPAPRTKLEAIFFAVFNEDFHNIGNGIMIKYKSVSTFPAKHTMTIGRETAA